MLVLLLSMWLSQWLLGARRQLLCIVRMGGLRRRTWPMVARLQAAGTVKQAAASAETEK